MVVAQQSTESFATDDIAIGPTDSIVRFEEIVAQALVVPFVMIMRQVLVNRVSQRSLAEEDHLFETLGFQRAKEAFDVGVQVGTLSRQANGLDARVREHVAT